MYKYLILSDFYKKIKGGEQMKFPSYKKIAEKLKKKDAIIANQCTCSNCNCKSANNMINLSKLYKEKLAKA